MAEPTQTFLEITPAERAWIDDRLAWGEANGAAVPDAASIDRLFARALEAVRTGAAPPDAANDAVNGVGALLGEHLCRSAGLRWAVVSDEYGTELCLRLPGTSLVLFPQSSAAKRWEAGETGWIEPFSTWARERVAEIARTPTP